MTDYRQFRLSKLNDPTLKFFLKEVTIFMEIRPYTQADWPRIAAVHDAARPMERHPRLLSARGGERLLF